MCELSFDALSAVDRERFEPLWRGPFDYDAARRRYQEQARAARTRLEATTTPMEKRPVTLPPALANTGTPK